MSRLKPDHWIYEHKKSKLPPGGVARVYKRVLRRCNGSCTDVGVLRSEMTLEYPAQLWGKTGTDVTKVRVRLLQVKPVLSLGRFREPVCHNDQREYGHVCEQYEDSSWYDPKANHCSYSVEDSHRRGSKKRRLSCQMRKVV